MSSDIYTNFIVIKNKALTKFHLNKKWALAKFLHIVFLFYIFPKQKIPNRFWMIPLHLLYPHQFLCLSSVFLSHLKCSAND